MKTRWSLLLMACLLIVGSFSGCNATDPAAVPPAAVSTTQATAALPAASTGFVTPKDKLNLEIMLQPSGGSTGWPDNFSVIEKINEKLNVKLTMTWVPPNAYFDKLNMLAASNTLLDSYILPTQSYNHFMLWRDKGIFLDVKPLLADYPNLVKYLDKSHYEILNKPGQYLGIPFYNLPSRNSLAIRQDWLDKLNLKAPVTTDDFLKVMKAFAKNDPDRNQKNDTFGFSLNISTEYEFTAAVYYTGAFGLANKWKEIDGKLVPMQVQTEELKSFVSFMAQAYADGSLDKDFSVNKASDPLAKFEAGKSGVSNVNPFELNQKIVPNVKKSDPNAIVVQLPPMIGPKGHQTTITNEVTDKIIINAKISKDKQTRLMMLYDYLLSDEGFDLIKHGVEGIHWKKVGDKFEKLPAFDDETPYTLQTQLIRRNDPGIQIRKWDDKEKSDATMAWIANNAKYPWPNDAPGLESATLTRVGKNIQQKWMETVTKVIMGQAPLSEIDAAVAGWKANGGDNIIKEINEAYLASK